MTYPIIGSYGVNPEDSESAGATACGVVVRERSRSFSNFRATGSLEDLMVRKQVVGIQGVDTRALAVHLPKHPFQFGRAHGPGAGTCILSAHRYILSYCLATSGHANFSVTRLRAVRPSR